MFIQEYKRYINGTSTNVYMFIVLKKTQNIWNIFMLKNSKKLFGCTCAIYIYFLLNVQFEYSNTTIMNFLNCYFHFTYVEEIVKLIRMKIIISYDISLYPWCILKDWYTCCLKQIWGAVNIFPLIYNIALNSRGNCLLILICFLLLIITHIKNTNM